MLDKDKDLESRAQAYIKTEKNLTYLLIVVLSLLLLIPHGMKFLELKPYTEVSKVDAHWEEDSYVDLVYTFHKTDGCDIKEFEVIGTKAGIPDYLKYEDLDEDTPWNRSPGLHALKIRVLLEGLYYDRVEVRTRHLCLTGEDTPEGAPEVVSIRKVFLNETRPQESRIVLP